MILIVCKTFTFDASHQLPDEEKYGKCRYLHGHTYCLEVSFIGKKENDWVIDFKEIKEIVKPIIERLDHSHINDVVSLSTAENILTEFIVPEIKKSIERYNNISLYAAKLWETPTSYCEWREDLQ